MTKGSGKVRRPKTRADCRQGTRPCPFVSCEHNLYLDVNPDTGAIKLNFPHLLVEEMAETCALDIADRGGMTLDELGAVLNLSRERVRQIELNGLYKIRAPAEPELDFDLDQKGGKTFGPPGNAPTASPERRLVHVELVGIGRHLADKISANPYLIHRLSPNEFEEFVCDRLSSLGLEPRRVGAINRKDGGIDIVFWPKAPTGFPFLGAAQVKHHTDPDVNVGPQSVRDFAGAISGLSFTSGLLITNTGFTPDAKWFARERARLIRLRGFSDIRRWLSGGIAGEEDWREIPREIELCPGVVIKIR